MIMLMIKKIKEGDSENNILILQYTVLKITFHRMGYLPFHCSTRIFPSPYTGSGNQIKTQYSK